MGVKRTPVQDPRVRAALQPRGCSCGVLRANPHLKLVGLGLRDPQPGPGCGGRARKGTASCLLEARRLLAQNQLALQKRVQGYHDPWRPTRCMTSQLPPAALSYEHGLKAGQWGPANGPVAGG